MVVGVGVMFGIVVCCAASTDTKTSVRQDSLQQQQQQQQQQPVQVSCADEKGADPQQEPREPEHAAVQPGQNLHRPQRNDISRKIHEAGDKLEHVMGNAIHDVLHGFSDMHDDNTSFAQDVRQHRIVLGLIWVYAPCLFLLPACIMANSTGNQAAAGGMLFLVTLWISGWAFLWLAHQGTEGDDFLAAVRVRAVDSDGQQLSVEGEDVLDILGLMAKMPRGEISA